MHCHFINILLTVGSWSCVISLRHEITQSNVVPGVKAC